MKETNPIDKLYQDGFQSFEATPDPKVWLKIEERLHPKKRRVFPLWWLSSGVASLLVLGLFLYPIYKAEEIEKPIIFPLKDNNIHKKVLKKVENKSTNELKVNTESKSSTNSTPKSKIEISIKAKLKQEFNVVESTIVKHKKTTIAHDTSTPEKIIKEPSLVIDKDLKNTNEKTGMKKPVEKKQNIIKEHKKELITRASEEPEINKKKTNKWEISPTVGLLKANSLTRASAIDTRLNNNPVSGENTITYGIKIGYSINDKWTFQSGVHLQKLDYNTSNITVFQSLTTSNSNNLENAEFDTNNLLLESSLELSDVTDPLLQPITTKGEIAQTYSYIEIPIEVKYKILNTQNFSTQLVSGFSTLILNKNEIIVSEENNQLVSGQATNLNNVNFSGNLGLDINYKINTNWSININPMFKTQLRTFSNNSSDFKPYFIGVYSGLQYKF